MIPFYENRDRELQVGHSVNMQFPPHLHGEVELLYVYSGALEVLVGQNVYLLEEGDFAAIFPNCVHSYRTPPEESSAVCLVIVQPRLAGEFSSSLQKLHPLDPVVRRAALHRDVPYAIDSLRQEGNVGSKAVFSAFVQLILARTMGCFQLEKNTDLNYFDLTYRTVSYLSEHYREPLSLETLARALGVSKYHLSRIFSARLHTSFSAYLGSLRVSLAQNLLKTTSLPISQIALDCGFGSQRSFNRIFLEQTGEKPGEYRK
ncbi:MAG: AraC family transcriptional regulator [Oscillospiraceae bacterium]|nr:AraC family transcriptional regulator [Oscillospiraceae bacterium]